MSAWKLDAPNSQMGMKYVSCGNTMLPALRKANEWNRYPAGGVLIALEQEIKRDEKGYGGNVARIEQVHAGTGRDEQKVKRCLHGCPHADDGKRIIQLYQEITDGGKEQEADNAVGPCGYVYDIP